jgi:hypothetical protein
MTHGGADVLLVSALLTHKLNLHRRVSMSLHRGFTLSLKLLVIMLVALTITSVALAAKTAPANSIYVHNQETGNGVAVIDEIAAAQAGWVVVYKRADLKSDMIVGYAPVTAGVNHGVHVTLDTARLKNVPTLWARLHEDKGTKGVFEWGRWGKSQSDVPVAENGQPVLVTFGTSGSGADLPVVPAISIKSQDTNANKIVVDSVTTPVDGWLVVFKDPSLRPTEIVGYVPVYHGVNQNLKMAVKGWRLDKQKTLWAALYEDKGTQRLLEVGQKGETRADPLVTSNGQPVIAAFGTTAP